jgi:ubiquitin thioesterase OTU1
MMHLCCVLSRKQLTDLAGAAAVLTLCGPAVTYNDGFLGQENEEYQAWILDKKHWGGAIELSILSQHYGRVIAAYDIQTKRCDR